MANIKELSLIQIESYDKWLNKVFKKLGLIDVNSVLLDQHLDEDESSDQYLISLDPKDWKNQDHYRLFGLFHKRHNATDDELKQAYRKKVLRHHPDKRGVQMDLDMDYYSCITKAYEILGDSIKRRSYDSIDHTFDNEIPSNNAYNKSHFFEVFDPVFKLNSRWSNIAPVPELGNSDSLKSDVDAFYSFWYSFDSWREYSYLDEEEKEKGENREERRWMEKQNRAVRTQRKREEMQRIRQLVENAYQCDPRIAKFKDEEKQKKLEQKLAKQLMIKTKQLEEEKQKRETEERERLVKQQKEDEIKAKKDEEKKQKEAFKRQLRKERKQIEVVFDKFNYFADDDIQKLQNLKEFDKIVKIFSLEELIKFREKFESLGNEELKRNFFFKEIENLNSKLDKERNDLISQNNSTNGQTNNKSGSKKVWSYDDIQLLIKAVKLFPAGTKDRWAVIAKFINDKSISGLNRNHRDVLEKAKDLQNSGQSQTLKEEANKNAFKKMEESRPNTNCDESAPSQRFDAPSSYVELNSNPWSTEEQQLLEQAMKTYPTTLGTERWDRISECIPNRSRTDCIKRYKYLVEMIKTKNAAKTAIHKSNK